MNKIKFNYEVKTIKYTDKIIINNELECDILVIAVPIS